MNVKSVDSRFVVWNMTRNDTINALNNCRLDKKCSL